MEGEVYPSVETPYGYFTATTIKQTNGDLTGGVDVGDADNDGKQEIVVGSWSHEMFIIEYDEVNEAWDSWIPWSDTLDLMITTVCDVDSDHPGNEVLAGGYSNKLNLIMIDGTHVQNRTLFTFDYDIWGIATGDIMPEVPGDEIAVCHWQTATYISVLHHSGSGWACQNLTIMAPVSKVNIGDFDPVHPGVEIVSGSEQGHLEEFYWDGGAFSSVLLNKDDRAIRNMAIADFNQANPGNELIYVTFSANAGNATMVYSTPLGWKTEFLYNSSKGLEALAVGEFNPLHKGDESVFAGYANTVTIVVENDTGPVAQDIFHVNQTLQSEFNGIAIGDVYPNHPGSEMFIVRLDGTIKMIVYDQPGVDVALGLDQDQELNAGGQLHLSNKCTSRGGFEGVANIQGSVERKDALMGGYALCNGIGLTISTSSIDVLEGYPSYFTADLATQNGTEAGQYRLNLTMTSPDNASIRDSYFLRFKVLVQQASPFSLMATPGSANVTATDQLNVTSYLLSVDPGPGMVWPLELGLSGLPKACIYSFSPPSLNEGDSSVLTINVQADAKPGLYPLTAFATGGGFSNSTAVDLNIVVLTATLNIVSFTATQASGKISVSATMKNTGNMPFTDFKVRFLLNSEPRYIKTVQELKPGEQLIINYELPEISTKSELNLEFTGLPKDVTINNQGWTLYLEPEGDDDTDTPDVLTVLLVVGVIVVVLAVVAAVGLVLYMRAKKKGREEEAIDRRKGPARGRGQRGTGSGRARGQQARDGRARRR